jgi:hypothetical protein
MLSSLVVSTLGARPAFAESSVPAGWQLAGAFTSQGAWQVAGENAVVRGELAPQTVVELGLKLGLKQKATLTLQGADARPMTLTLEAQDNLLRARSGAIPLPDASVKVLLRAPDGTALFNDDYFIRPNPASYKGDEATALIERWSTLPSAGQHELHLKIVSDANGASIWLDDRFVGRSRLSTPAKLQLALVAGNALGRVQVRAAAVDRNRFVPIGLQGYRTGGDAAALPLRRGALQMRNGVPFEVAAAGDAVDVGVSRWLDEKVRLRGYVDPQYTRSSFDHNRDNVLMAVPADDYAWAHLLVAVDPDPHKTPVLTLVLTRFTDDRGDAGGRGDGMTDSSIRLERKAGKWPDGVRRIGVVRRKNDAGREVEMPLLQVTIPLRSGEISDVVDETGLSGGRSTQHLDLELTKELHPVRTKNYSTFSYKPLGKPSAARVYALTLERAPVKARVLPRRAGHVFQSTEKIGFDISLQNRVPQAFSGTLRWRLTDFYGQVVQGACKVHMPPQAQPSMVAVELPGLKLGWHKAELSLADARNHAVWQQTTSLAVLAPDTRKAGQESPYGTWWFRSVHGGTDSLDEVAPLFRRMGFRHVNPWGKQANPGGAELAKRDMSLSMIPYQRGGTVDQAMAIVDDWVAQNPQVDRAMIFHESGTGAGWMFPPEFLGQPTPQMDDKQRASYDKAVPRGIEYARRIRAKYPHLKLIVGNGPLPFIAGLMQNGYPKELVDEWGDEEVGQSIIPEAPPTSSQSDLYWIREYDKKYGYDKPVTTAYEWRGRGTNPGNLTELEQAQYYVRDVLKALSFDATSINPGLLYDVGDSYYYSRWGSGGFLHRYPLLNPKISYVAMAVLTQVLDQAKLQRVLATDSPTLHAMEFRQGNEYVYALWVPRGEKKVDVTFANDDAATLTDMNGRATSLPVANRRAQITVSASPLYLRCAAPITALKSGATLIAPPPSTPRVARPMNDLSQWDVVREPDTALETAHFDFPRRVGKIAVRAVADDERKAVIELTLAPEPTVPWPVARYITLKPKNAVALPGTPEAVGVWVKGNSSWGKVFFEIEDAKGEKFYSIGAEDDGWSLADWKGTQQIDFDGWNYISVKLPAQYSGGFPQPQQSDWRSSGGDGVVDYPVKVSKLVVTMRDKIVQLNRPVDVPNRSIRLSGLSCE